MGNTPSAEMRLKISSQMKNGPMILQDIGIFAESRHPVVRTVLLGSIDWETGDSGSGVNQKDRLGRHESESLQGNLHSDWHGPNARSRHPEYASKRSRCSEALVVIQVDRDSSTQPLERAVVSSTKRPKLKNGGCLKGGGG